MSDDEVGEAPLSPHPRCPCGAGICKVFTVKNSGPNTGRKFFVCPVPKVWPFVSSQELLAFVVIFSSLGRLIVGNAGFLLFLAFLLVSLFLF